MEAYLQCSSLTPLTAQAWYRSVQQLLPPSALFTSGAQLYIKYVVNRYKESQRHYHTLQHLEEMFVELEAYSSAKEAWLRSGAFAGTVPRQTLVIDLSVLFHDAVYDPTQSDNEEQSVVWLRQFLAEARALCQPVLSDSPAATDCAGAETLLWRDTVAAAGMEQTVASVILATKQHLSVPPSVPMHLGTRAPDVAFEHDTDLHVVLDIDLAVLGRAAPDYKKYAEAISQEYSFVSREQFVKGRSAFLRSFLSKDQWYKTPFFFGRHEAHARENVQRELEALTALISGE